VVVHILEPILRGLVVWVNALFIDICAYAANQLITLMSMDLTYFETSVPVVRDIVTVFIAVGWALLLGNLVFQATRSMFSGLGFEGESPQILLIRSGIFGFLLLASRQICDIGMSISGKVIAMLALPNHIDIVTVNEEMFSGVGSAGWLLVIIMDVIVMFQIIKLLFEIGERYVIVGVLTFLSPLAFAMGGSKSTNDIFKGWVRMFGSMLLMMVLNIVFLKMVISAMATVPTGTGVLPWMVLIIALAKVARKIDSHITRLGLNPAATGDGLKSGLPGMLAYTAARSLVSSVARNVGGKTGGTKTAKGASGGARNPVGNTAAGRTHYASGVNSTQNAASAVQQNTTNTVQQHGNAPALSRQTANQTT
jgi:hypothetical protein